MEWRRRAWRCSEALRICAEEIGNGKAKKRDAMLWSGLEKRRFGIEWRSYELETKIRKQKGDNA